MAVEPEGPAHAPPPAEVADDETDEPTRQVQIGLGAPAQPERRIEATFEPGAVVGQFRIMRLLGRGGMGEVFLARDTTLGRKLALKVIHPGLFDSERARARFLFEARTTAKFNHPHIVTVYAVGEFEGRPYLALEYVEGETLKARLVGRELSLQESLRIARAISVALVEAHQSGVLHRDLKPGNVLIGLDGRVRVLDFGLAKVVQDDTTSGGTKTSTIATTADGETTNTLAKRTLGVGTPGYMAPEQWRESGYSGATDVWALGVLLYRMLTRRLPYAQSTVVEQALIVCAPEPAPRVDRLVKVPPALADLVAHCLCKDPVGRPTAVQLVEALTGIIEAGTRALDQVQDPFRGLLPFSAEHAQLFFGREAEIASFVERVRLHPVMPVVGSSASGKSSFVQAGVIPRLREQQHWTVFHLRPGARPFQTLATRLLGLGDETSWPSGASGEGRVGPGLPISPPGRPAAGRGPGAAGSAPMLNEDGVPTAVWSRDDPRVEADDSLDETQKIKPLEERLRQWPRRLSIELRDIAEERGTKVLLFVDQLEELFTLCDDGDTRRAFMEALCTGADDVADPVRVIFAVRDDFLGRIVTGPAVRDALGNVTVIQRPDATALGEVLRRPVEAVRFDYDDPSLVDQMVQAVEDEPACLPLLQFAAKVLWERRDEGRKLLLRGVYEQIGGVEGALAQHADGVLQGLSPADLQLARQLFLRLVTGQRTRAVVAVARALEGLGAGAEHVLGRLTQARLVSVSKQHSAKGAEAVLELAHGSLISQWTTLARWIDESKEELAFLEEVRQASELWDRRGRRDDELWQAHACREARRKLERIPTEVPRLVAAFLQASDRRSRSRGRRRRALIGAVLVLLILVAGSAVGAALFIRQQRDAAEQQRAEVLREGARAALSSGAVLEARAKLREAFEAEDSTSARALWWRLRDDPLWYQQQLGSPALGVAFAPDGTAVAVATQDGPVYVFDTRTGASRILRGHADQVFSVAFSPDGKLLASGSLDQTVRLWSLELGTAKLVLRGHKSGVHGVSISPDGRWVAAGGHDKTVRLWDTVDGEQKRMFEGHEGAVRSVSFSADGHLLASASADKTARVWDARSGDCRHVLRGHEREVYGVRFSPDGTLLASGGDDAAVRLWTVADGKEHQVLRGHQGGVTEVSFSPDGKRLASGSADGTVRIWSLGSGDTLREYENSAQVWGVSFSADGRWLATGSADNVVRLRTVDVGRTVRPIEGHQAAVLNVSLSPDGKLLASCGIDKTVRLWDVATGAQRRVLRGHAAAVTDVRFSPDGKRLASGSADQTIRLWTVDDGSEERVLAGHRGEVHALRFSRNGRLLASGSHDRTVRVWDVRSGTMIRVLKGHTDRVRDVAFGRGTRRLASASDDGTVRLFDVSRRRVDTVLEGHEGPVHGVSISPGGKRIASGGHDGAVRIWDPEEETSSVIARLPTRIYSVSYHPDGKRIAASSSDGVARIWDLESKQATLLRGHRSEVNAVRFSADGKLAATASADGTPRIWSVETGLPFWRAPLLLAKPPLLLSHRGWVPLDGSAAAEAGAAKWKAAVEQKGRLAAPSGEGSCLCLHTVQGGLELWDLDADRLVSEQAQPQLEEVRGAPQGCLVRTKEEVWHIERSGRRVALRVAGTPTALGWSDVAAEPPPEDTPDASQPEGPQLLVVAGEKLLAFNAAGDGVAEVAVAPGAVSVSASNRFFLLGYPDGSIEMVPRAPWIERPSYRLERVPSSPVLRLVSGPQGTVIAGYGNGLVGLWDQHDGARLGAERLHGPVIHLALVGQKLYAATDLGSHLEWDLAPFHMDHCELLREIWEHVPVVWERGHAVVRSAPPKHRCR